MGGAYVNDGRLNRIRPFSTPGSVYEMSAGAILESHSPYIPKEVNRIEGWVQEMLTLVASVTTLPVHGATTGPVGFGVVPTGWRALRRRRQRNWCYH